MNTGIIDWHDAYDHVASLHRHHEPPRGHKFCLGCWVDGDLVGVAIIGRPLSRVLEARGYLEVTRTCTNGHRNANSCLYGASWREIRRRGYLHACTYTQAGESGASLRGAGWQVAAHLRPRRGWNCPARDRADLGRDGIERLRWEPYVPSQ